MAAGGGEGVGVEGAVGGGEGGDGAADGGVGGGGPRGVAYAHPEMVLGGERVQLQGGAGGGG